MEKTVVFSTLEETGEPCQKDVAPIMAMAWASMPVRDVLAQRTSRLDYYGYRNIYGHERLWLKLWARGDCNCAILLRGAAPKQNSTIAVTEGPLVLTQRLE